ncbi:hypothetical protein [uncultured Bosea sp.]|uniref:hypothetical protein n=1 Tax=uncultured Bosea sp. TaxID=211457 RepID=UPI0025E8EF0E|nr:hypothetical protein [uncultured Bosea sp.]
MLTAVIRSDGSQQALAATLAVLIPAVAEGFLGHAVLVDTAGSPETERAADATGARYLRASHEQAWQDAAAKARGDRLVLFDAGDVPQAHWVQAVERHLLLAASKPALIPSRGAAASLRERIAFSVGSRGLAAGLVMPKAMALAGRLDQAPVRLSVLRERAG